ncbi:MAG: glycosyltransferase family 9 protein [Candidatus Aminicenantales bacterium]
MLLFRMGGLGDLLITFPSINLLRKTLHPCSITLVCREEYGFILKETGVVDNIISAGASKLAPLFASPPYPEDITCWLEGFSMILGWMQKKDSLNLETLCISRFKGRCRFIVCDQAYHGPLSTFFFQKTAEFLPDEKVPLPSFNECLLLPLTTQQKQDGLKLLGEKALVSKEKLAVVHPGSGTRDKCWPLKSFLEKSTVLPP